MGTVTCLPQALAECCVCGVLTLGLPLTTRCPGTLHRAAGPWFQAIQPWPGHTCLLLPGTWVLGFRHRKAGLVPDSDLPTAAPFHPPPLQGNEAPLGVGGSSALLSVPENQDPPCRQPGRGGGVAAPHPGESPGKDAGRSVRPPAALITKVAAASHGCELPGPARSAAALTQPSLSLPGEAHAEEGTCSVPCTGGRMCH